MTPRNEYERAERLAAAALSRFPRGQDGRTPEAVRATPAWQAARAKYGAAFAALRAHNRAKRGTK